MQGNSYCYDLNGNQTVRNIGGNTYTLAYDAENRLAGVSGSVSNTYVYDGDHRRVKETTYENLAYGLTATSDATLYWQDALTDNDLYVNNSSPDEGEYAYTGQSGSHYIQLDLGALYWVDKIKVWHLFQDGRTYHGVKLQVSTNGSVWTTIYDSSLHGEYVETQAGKTHTFTPRSMRYVREYLNGSTTDAGNQWVELEVYGSRTTVQLGDYFEWTGSTSTMKKYYTGGGTRAALRVGTGSGTVGLKWLLSDHLGSAAITAEGSTGTRTAELRYTPCLLRSAAEVRHNTPEAIPRRSREASRGRPALCLGRHPH